MKVEIISNGTPEGTKIVNVETGEILEQVQRIDWNVAIGKLATAKIELIEIPVKLIGELNKNNIENFGSNGIIMDNEFKKQLKKGKLDIKCL